MYQALYRKYRPKNLDEVAGQKTIVKILKNTIKKNQISHAYLFCGPRGTGKTSIAKILAKTINCTNLNGVNPCDKCDNCIEFNQKTSTDIIEIDAASNNGVDEIRELRNKINLVPNTGKYKIYIIDEVHMLTIGAFNALLKTLEEPPAHAVFILATTEPHKIPITILSRCQRLDFQKISLNDIVTRLKQICEIENIKINDDALEQIASLSDGGMRDSLGMLDKLVSYTDDVITIENVNEINGVVTQNQIHELLINITNKDYKNIFEMLDKLNMEGKDFVKLSEEIMKNLRNNLVETLKNNIETDLIKNIGRKNAIRYIEQFGEIINLIKNSNNQKIIMETNIIKLMTDDLEENVVSKIPKPVVPKESIKIETYEKQEEQPTSDISDDRIKLLEQLKKIRIDNTLSNFNKKLIPEIQSKLDDIKNYLIDPIYSESASLILDGKLKAASDKNIIFVYDSENIELNFNLKINIIEELLEKIGLGNYKVVATNIDDWNVIKEEFNSKSKTYKYTDDTKLISEIFNEIVENPKKNSIENMFDDIISYSK